MRLRKNRRARVICAAVMALAASGYAQISFGSAVNAPIIPPSIELSAESDEIVPGADKNAENRFLRAFSISAAIPAGYYQQYDPSAFYAELTNGGGFEIVSQSCGGAKIGDMLRDKAAVKIVLAPQPGTAAGTHTIEAALHYQLCAENGMCLPPSIKKFSLSVELPENAAQEKQAAFPAIYILFAFLGGLLLNCMPCVLPVMLIKINALSPCQGKSRRQIAAYSLAYASGVVATFIALGLIAVALRLCGRRVGWGFQFQNPVFTMTLCFIVFAFALSLLGVYELPPIRAGTRPKAAQSGAVSAFFNGAFIVLLSAPCTAPFLGSAAGFAFAAEPPAILLFFTAAGLGLSAPFFIPILFPGLIAKLPRSGAWTQGVKIAGGFCLLFAALWLLDVLSVSADWETVRAALFFCVCLTAALLIWSRGGGVTAAKKRRAIAGIAAAAIIAGAAIPVYAPRLKTSGAKNAALRIPAGFSPFDEQAAASARAERRPVFIAFGAQWCLTCKTNENAVLSRKSVRAAFDKANAVLFYVDYTNWSADAERRLNAYGRAGVPLYLYFAPDAAEALILPELLTADMILDLLRQ